MDVKQSFICSKSTQLVFTLVITLAFYEGGSVCPSDWFGISCQYKCHCKGDNCTSDGNCPLGCEENWFGPQCQYVNLVDEIHGPDIGCGIKESTNPVVVIQLRHHTVFTWMRLEFKEALETFHWQLLNMDNSWMDCKNSKSVRVNLVTFDLFCDTKNIVKAVSLSTSKPNMLCNVYVSGGRNVALKAIAKQTSTFSNAIYDETYGRAEHAVDGNTASNYSEKSCSQTQHYGKKISLLELELFESYWINSYRLYNEINQSATLTYTIHLLDACKERFDSFELEMNNSSNFHVHIPGESAKFVRVRNKHFVLLCEIELFGDSECLPGLYGRDCERGCNCLNQSEACLTSTGGCVSGCPIGYTGEDCSSQCPIFTYGHECRQKCSHGCGGQGYCHPSNGTCLDVCKYGYNGSHCFVESSFSSYTQNDTIAIGIGAGLCLLVVIMMFGGLVMYVLKRTTNASNQRMFTYAN